MAKKEKVKKEEPAAEKPAGPEGEEGAPAKKKMAGKTLVLFIILPAVLVLGGGGAAAMMLMGGGSAKAETAEAADGGHGDEKEEKKDEHGEEKKEDHGGGGGDDHGGGGGVANADGDEADVGHMLECADDNPCYYAMPKLVVNLAATEGERSPAMELELTLEAELPSAFKDMIDLMPRIKDQLNAFLRELRVEDLNGSQGTWMMRRELLKRFNTVLDPRKINAVLIEGMFIQ